MKARFIISALILGASIFSASGAVPAKDSTAVNQNLTHYQQNRSSYMQVSTNGKVQPSKMKIKETRGTSLTDRGIKAPKGLSGRHIAMWQSHGRYFDLSDRTWKWQRPSLFQTTEDLFTQSFMVPFLVPMLENAGANTILPRERDWHTEEIIIDNDVHETVSGRIHGRVETTGKWKRTEEGFADLKANYRDEENPFTMGTSLTSNITVKGEDNTVSWWAEIPQRDEYAVYVSYTAGAKNTTAAQYTIHTAGADIKVKVNQKMGAGTWVYLGTYEFPEGEHKLVSLSSHGTNAANVVVADAVKIGGGMGNIERDVIDGVNYTTSSMPRFAEGARYFMQWSGIPAKVWSQNDFLDDYRDDLMSRGEWVQYLSGGSWVNPRRKTGLKIPIDMSFAWHTDAGTAPDASIIGTLGIYTRLANGSSRLPSGYTRNTSRELTELLVSQIERDLSAQWDSLWTIRDVWNKSYSESRTTGTPAVLLELLSHQNFEDMKYGLDPMFRFTAARACYKAILKYLSMHYGRSYAVQPLPVNAFKVSLNNMGTSYPTAELGWMETVDKMEITAHPDYFILYTRMDDGGWDAGTRITVKPEDGWYRTAVPLELGHTYSFKVVAGNDGGVSFPSETLAVGIPASDNPSKVTIVNAFHRVSGPKWFDSTMYAGFDNRNDSGVPYIRDWSFVGEQFEYNRLKEYKGGVDSGFGACYEDYMNTVIGGNTFDYTYMHGKEMMAAGYAFDSSSDEAAGLDSSVGQGSFALDIICGKECVVQTGTRSGKRGGIYSDALMSTIRRATDMGCGILISGAYIAKEAEDAGVATQNFVKERLGFSLRREHGSRTGEVKWVGRKDSAFSFPNTPCPESYCVESPDALSSYMMGSNIVLEYKDSRLPAGLHIDMKGYKVAAYGFPIEILSDTQQRSAIIHDALEYLKGKKSTSPKMVGVLR